MIDDDKNTRADFIELFKRFLEAVPCQEYFYVIQNTEEYKNIIVDFEHLILNSPNMSDDEFKSSSSKIEAVAENLVELLRNPYKINQAEVAELLEICIEKINIFNNAKNYKFVETDENNFWLSKFILSGIDEKTMPLMVYPKERTCKFDFSVYRRYVIAWKKVQVDFDSGKEMLLELIAEGVCRAKYALAYALIIKDVEKNWKHSFQLIIECINDGIFDALFLLLAMNHRLGEKWLSWKNQEDILKITAYSEHMVSNYNRTMAIAELSKLYAYGYVNNREFEISSDVDLEKAFHYASFLLETSKNTHFRNDAFGVLLRVESSRMMELNGVLVEKQREVERIILDAIKEASSSKTFSEIYRNILYEARPNFVSFLKTIIEDDSMSVLLKNKTRYALAEDIERKDPKRTKELLLSAAYDGCCDSQDVLFSYANGKTTEVQLLAAIAPMIAERAGEK